MFIASFAFLQPFADSWSMSFDIFTVEASACFGPVFTAAHVPVLIQYLVQGPRKITEVVTLTAVAYVVIHHSSFSLQGSLVLNSSLGGFSAE